MLSRYSFVGRRRGGRRAGECADIYVDRFRAAEWSLVGGVVGLATIDWAWTLLHLSRGVDEANPALAAVLAVGGVAAFTAVKLGVTLLAGVFLLLHSRFRWARALLPVALVIYLALLMVHLGVERAVAT
jgi:hypothetical protein